MSIIGLNNGQILIFKLYIKELNISSKEIIEYIGTINFKKLNRNIIIYLYNY